MARELSAMGERWRSWLPVVLRDSADYLAVINAVSREVERLEASIELVRRQFFPQQADELLKVWEYVLTMTIEPAGLTVQERQTLVVATLRSLNTTPEGRDWTAKVTALIGSGWTYDEHQDGVVGTPPEGTIRLNLPFPPASSAYARAEAQIRTITQAHLDIILANEGGFILDEDELDQAPL